MGMDASSCTTLCCMFPHTWRSGNGDEYFLLLGVVSGLCYLDFLSAQCISCVFMLKFIGLVEEIRSQATYIELSPNTGAQSSGGARVDSIFL